VEQNLRAYVRRQLTLRVNNFDAFGRAEKFCSLRVQVEPTVEAGVSRCHVAGAGPSLRTRARLPLAPGFPPAPLPSGPGSLPGRERPGALAPVPGCAWRRAQACPIADVAPGQVRSGAAPSEDLEGPWALPGTSASLRKPQMRIPKPRPAVFARLSFLSEAASAGNGGHGGRLCCLRATLRGGGG
jgi:hypothetical protein